MKNKVITIMEDRILEKIGTEEFLNSIIQALTTDQKMDFFTYICRTQDVYTDDIIDYID